jgi:hypothetical protein
MAKDTVKDGNKDVPDIKDYKRNYEFEKEHQDTYKKVLGAYSLKERKEDNQIHNKGKKKAMQNLESLADEVEAIEHEDQMYKLLGKILHNYENSKVEVYNAKKGSKDKHSKLDYDDMHYTDRIREIVQQIIRNPNGRITIESLLNEIKEGNVEQVADQILSYEHGMYQRKKTMHKMREALPPNKDPNFYFKMANVMASKRPQDYTATELWDLGKDRDTLLGNIMDDYETFKSNELKRAKPAAKKKK